MKKILILLPLIVGLSGCRRSIECTDPPISIAFISFISDDIDTLIIRKFRIDNNFQTLLDTVYLTSTNSGITRYGDTSYISVSNPNKEITPGYDWQIFIPATNRRIAITNIKEEETTNKCGAIMPSACFCYDEILSLKVDNQPGVLKNDRGNILFIK